MTVSLVSAATTARTSFSPDASAISTSARSTRRTSWWIRKAYSAPVRPAPPTSAFVSGGINSKKSVLESSNQSSHCSFSDAMTGPPESVMAKA